MRIAHRSIYAIIAALGLLVGCKATPTEMKISPANATLTEKGATANLSAEPVDKNGARVEGVLVAWTSSDENVATVDSSGVVKPMGSGTAEITAAADKVSSSVPVTVSLAGALKLDKNQITLTPEVPSDMLTATLVDDRGEAWAGQAAITWTSGDPMVVTVENGKVTAVGNGTTTVTATAGEMKAEAAVTVTMAAPVVTDETRQEG